MLLAATRCVNRRLDILDTQGNQIFAGIKIALFAILIQLVKTSDFSPLGVSMGRFAGCMVAML